MDSNTVFGGCFLLLVAIGLFISLFFIFGSLYIFLKEKILE
jgi:hypothetical protein